MSINFDALINYAVKGAEKVRTKPRKWTPEEEAFMIANLGIMSETEIGRALGRTAAAVHIRWSRELDATAPSKDPNVITGNRAAELLGIDVHVIMGWVDMGLMPGRMMAGERKIRLIDRQALRRWVLNPMNWPYFDQARVRDTDLKRMLKKRARRWGDEWWSTRQVADYHGVKTGDVIRYAKLGRIETFRLPVSLGGRYSNRTWSNHFVLRSVAIRMNFTRGTKLNSAIKWTPAADAWILKARDQLGMTFVHIGRTMKVGGEKLCARGGTRSNPKISRRYWQLKKIEKAARRSNKQHSNKRRS
jgi:hypothetical protein